MKDIPGLEVLNAWKVKINSEKFIITPAHNIIYKPDNINWQLSHFVPSKYRTDWYVPDQYFNSKEYNLLWDLAWKPISKYSQTIDSEYIDINKIYDAKFYYYQPYNWENLKVNKESYSLGCGITTIYQSPGSEYFEAINIGWRGLSGSAVTNANTKKFIGLFIRRIGNIGIEKSDSTLQTEMTGVSRGFIMPTKIIEKIIFSNTVNTTKIY